MTIDAKTDPVPAILKSKGLSIRVAALVAGIAGLILPAATGSVTGVSQSANVLQLVGWSVLPHHCGGMAC